MHQGRLREALSTGRGAVGGWCSLAGSFSAEVVAAAGCDYATVDMQHGLASFSDLVPMIQAISLHGATPLVRIPHRDLATAQRALDAGAEGIIIPYVMTSDEAAEAVAACRYPPAGYRSYGPTRSRLHLGGATNEVNEKVLCFVMIETKQSLASVEDIARCPGVDGLYIGPADLALALGLPVGSTDPDFESALDRVLRACSDNGIAAALHTPDGDAARAALERGFAMATVGTDAALLSRIYGLELAKARGRVQDVAERT